MRILSNKKDYYDSASVYGIDKAHTFVRNIGEEYTETTIPYGLHSFWIPSTTYGKNEQATKKTPNYKPFILGFCGKLYIGWRIWWYKKTYETPFEKKFEEITYNKKDIIKVIEKSYKDTKYELRKLEYFYQETHEKLFPEIFHNEKTAYFVAELSGLGKFQKRDGKDLGIIEIIHTPLLKDYNVATLINPVTAFQEIDMFLFGVLGLNEKEIDEVDEKYRMAARGMDKTSFRQLAPGERKERRKLNKQRKRNKKKTK